MLRTLASLALLFAVAAPPALAAPSAIVPSSPSGEAQATAAVPAPPKESVGLYPLQLPDGQRPFADKLAEQLHDGAMGLPNLRAFDLLPRGACLFDEPGCLAAAARSASLTRMVSGRVVQTERGFAFELRLVSARDASELRTERGAVEGGPLDLAGGLEHGVCELLGGAPCDGMLSVRAEDVGAAHLFVDGTDAGALPLAQRELPVGRHLLRVGQSERRVRIAYQRETRLACARRGEALELLDEDGGASPSSAAQAGADGSLAAPPSAIFSSATHEASIAPETRAGRLMLAAGGALLMTAAGLEVYAQAESGVLDRRYQGGQLTAADASSYGHVHTAGVAALLLGATGAGALATGGLLFLLSPDGAALEGKF